MKCFEKKYSSYRLSVTDEVTKNLNEGFVPWGSAFFHPDKKCCCQPMVKFGIDHYIKKLNLKEREEECLKWIMNGYSQKRIASYLSCSVENVKKLTNTIKWKVKVTSKDALIDEVRKNT
jgi:DNA-binding CsgD family transcriptional regulator